jgi:hypothetical protein
MTSDAFEVNPKQLVTKKYLDTKFQQALAPVKTELAILKWLVGFKSSIDAGYAFEDF